MFAAAVYLLRRRSRERNFHFRAGQVAAVAPLDAATQVMPRQGFD